MNRRTCIFGISGGLWRESYNSAALRAAAGPAPAGAAVRTFWPDGIPIFNQDGKKNPPRRKTEEGRSRT